MTNKYSISNRCGTVLYCTSWYFINRGLARRSNKSNFLTSSPCLLTCPTHNLTSCNSDCAFRTRHSVLANLTPILEYYPTLSSLSPKISKVREPGHAPRASKSRNLVYVRSIPRLQWFIGKLVYSFDVLAIVYSRDIIAIQVSKNDLSNLRFPPSTNGTDRYASPKDTIRYDEMANTSASSAQFWTTSFIQIVNFLIEAAPVSLLQTAQAVDKLHPVFRAGSYAMYNLGGIP